MHRGERAVQVVQVKGMAMLFGPVVGLRYIGLKDHRVKRFCKVFKKKIVLPAGPCIEVYWLFQDGK